MHGVKIFQTPDIAKGHGASLNFAARYFHYCDYLICWETDMICHSDWFETLLSYMEGDVWMAGYEHIHRIHGKDHRDWYVMPNPGIYRVADLLRIDSEVLMNQNRLARFGENYSEETFTPDIRQGHVALEFLKKDIACMNDLGVFTERRGFAETSDLCPDGKGSFMRPTPLWYENGQWAFYYMQREGALFRILQCKDFYRDYNGDIAREKTVFENGKFTHYWAGTRSWDFLTHKERNLSQINYVRPKIELEVALWKEVVPDEIRTIVPEVFNMDRSDEQDFNNLAYIDTTKMGEPYHQQIARETAEWFKSEFIETNYNVL
jgi:hypothetical protein